MTNEGEKEMNYCGGGRSRWWKCFVIFPLVVAAMFGVAYIVMLLWNEIIPTLFTTVGPLTYWHAVGLLILCKILFGGFRKGCHRGGWRHRKHMYAWKEKWMSMSDEEKAKFKEEWKNRCGR